MIKWEAASYLNVSIKMVEVDRESKNCVWINGRRENKISSWKTYHDTFTDAKTYLFTLAKSERLNAQLKIDMAVELKRRINEINPPKE